MRPRSLFLSAIVGLALLAAGFTAGYFKGMEVATTTCKHMMNPLLISTGDQARNTLVFLEKGKIDEYTGYLEKEVSHALDYLDHLERQGEIPSGSPMLHTQKRLREYRASHPIERHASATTAREE